MCENKRSIFRLAYLPVLIFISFTTQAQLVSGPMLGPVELRTAKLWIEVKPGSSADFWYWKKGQLSTAKRVIKKTSVDLWFTPLQFDAVDLEPNTTYEYRFLINNIGNNKPMKADGSFTTKDLWQWRKPAPDFSFLTGSCAYMNEPPVDRPGKPYGGDSSIFETMAKEQAAFMFWMGDNWYTREVDYYDAWGLWSRASDNRAAQVMQNFWKSTSHYAMWDDHDYGPNDIGVNYILKNISRQVFMNYWLNPSYGMNDKGIYSMISYSDVDIFIMDDRWWRSADNMKDSVNGKPNPDKEMWGKQQIDWLKNSLLYSKATFKIIANGSQVLNPASPFDKLLNCPVEYYDVMGFLEENKINGVLFMSGDRHHSEIIKVNRTAAYPLYDVTISPLTAGTHSFSGPEKNNPYRVLGIDEKQNYGKLSFTGDRGKRKLTVEFFAVKGEKLGEWSINENDLKYNR